MSEAKDREKINISESAVPSCDAVQFISQCDNVSEDGVRTFLSQHLSKTDTHLKQQDKEYIEKYIRIITKGLRKKSKQANALRFFYYGYYIRQLEELLERNKNEVIAAARMVLVSKKHYSDILRFLYEKGCSQQKNISESLGINKSNLNRIMNQLLDNDLVVRSVGPKCVFYELSSPGYRFVRESAFIANSKDRSNSSKIPLQRHVERIKMEVLQDAYVEELKQICDMQARWILAKRNIELDGQVMVESPVSAHKIRSEQGELVDVKVDMESLEMIREMIQKKRHKEMRELGHADIRDFVRNEY